MTTRRLISGFLTLLAGGLVLVGVGLVLWPRQNEVRANPLLAGELEIAWLYQATSATTWERFVSAVDNAAARLNEGGVTPHLEVDATGAFPHQTSAVPEVALLIAGGPRLVFRWYKLTSDQKTDAWLRALVTPGRLPLAFIGGSSSDLARDLAEPMAQRIRELNLSKAPLLLLTTATADRVLGADGSEVPLHTLYPDRTYRFCFTNRQMAATVSEFVVSRQELRPDAGPTYLVLWGDDPYSIDLTMRFREALSLWSIANWLAVQPGTGGLPCNLAAICCCDLSQAPESVNYSLGGFDQPNRWEGPTIERIVETKGWYPLQHRPLLVLSAASTQPARRFLRGLVRTAPAEARRFVVATGDALPFNTVYRDRNLAWPVQDLPFDLVFFCHRNPVERSAGFRPQDESRPPPGEGGASATGTEDLLLFRDIVEAITLACGERMFLTGDALGERLRQARWEPGRGITFASDGALLFDDTGQRRSGTGEHVVWLRPLTQGERVRPRATLEIWAWMAGEAARHWEVRDFLDVYYEAAPTPERR